MEPKQTSETNPLKRNQSTGNSTLFSFWSSTTESTPSLASSSVSVADDEISGVNFGYESEDCNTISYFDDCSIMVNIDDEDNASSNSETSSLSVADEAKVVSGAKPSLPPKLFFAGGGSTPKLSPENQGKPTLSPPKPLFTRMEAPPKLPPRLFSKGRTGAKMMPPKPGKGLGRAKSLQSEKVCRGNLDFFADSPVFDAFVEKEMNSLGVSTELMRDIASKTKEFSQKGIHMVKSTRRLARSCRVGSKRAIGNLSFKENKEKREKTLGHDMANAFEHLGDVLEEIASAQEHMCQMLENSLVQELETFAAHATKTSQMRADAEKETNKAEQLLFKYLNGKNAGGNYEAGGNANANSNEPMSYASRATKVARWNHNIQTVLVSQTSAEMKRFQLSQRIVDLKHEQNHKLSTSAIKMLSEMHTFLCHCSNLVSGLTPKMGEMEDKYQKEQDRYRTNEVPLWQEREKKLEESLIVLKKAECLAKENESKICNAFPSKLNAWDLDFQSMEFKSQIWNLPEHLASKSRYHRVQSAGVLAEGWLYQKTTSSLAFLSKEEWKRRWIVLRNDGIFCFSGKGKDKNSTTMEQKLCDVKLCTTRKLDNNKFPSSRFCFELIGPKIMEPVLFQARGPYELQMWIDRIRSATSQNLASTKFNHPKRIRSVTTGSVSSGKITEFHKVKDTIIEMRNFSSENFVDYPFVNLNRNGSTDPVAEQIMKDNPFCADCGKCHPDWAVINLGVVVCLECSGVHRSLGVHISKVRSLTLDSLSKREGSLLLSLGNNHINSILEKEAPPELFEKRRSNRREWIQRKYAKKEFVGHSGKGSASSPGEIEEERACRDLYEASRIGDVKGVAKAFICGGRVDWKNKQEGGMNPLEVCGIGLCLQSKHTGTAEQCEEFLLLNGAKKSAKTDIEETKGTNADETAAAAT